MILRKQTVRSRRQCRGRSTAGKTSSQRRRPGRICQDWLPGRQATDDQCEGSARSSKRARIVAFLAELVLLGCGEIIGGGRCAMAPTATTRGSCPADRSGLCRHGYGQSNRSGRRRSDRRAAASRLGRGKYGPHVFYLAGPGLLFEQVGAAEGGRVLVHPAVREVEPNGDANPTSARVSVRWGKKP